VIGDNDKLPMRERISLRARMHKVVDNIGWLRALVGSNLLWGVVFTALLTILLLPIQPIQGERYSLNSVVQEQIVAQRDMSIPDIDATEKKKNERVAAVKSVYNFDDNKWRLYVKRIERLFALGREAIAVPDTEAEPPAQPRQPPAEDEALLQKLEGRISEELGIEVPRDVLVMLARAGFEADLQNSVARTVSPRSSAI